MGNEPAGLQLCCALLFVLSSLQILCFFFSQEDFPHNAHHREIAISISNYTVKHGDTGLVIVGGRMEMQPHVCCNFRQQFFVCVFPYCDFVYRGWLGRQFFFFFLKNFFGREARGSSSSIKLRVQTWAFVACSLLLLQLGLSVVYRN